jgi:hypothetical protein
MTAKKKIEKTTRFPSAEIKKMLTQPTIEKGMKYNRT